MMGSIAMKREPEGRKRKREEERIHNSLNTTAGHYNAYAYAYALDVTYFLEGFFYLFCLFFLLSFFDPYSSIISHDTWIFFFSFFAPT